MNPVSNSDSTEKLQSKFQSNWKIYAFLGIAIVFTAVSLALSAATLATVIDRVKKPSDSSDVEQVPEEPKTLVESINRKQIMKHVQDLQMIADNGGGTRAIATQGFNGTIDYITQQLQQNTDFNVQHQYFTVKNYVVRGNPQLQFERSPGNVKDYIYLANFTYMVFAAAANFPSFVPLIAVPERGCDDKDWNGLPASGAVVLVKRGDCTFPEKIQIAEKYGAIGLLLYNDGGAADRFAAVQGIRASQDSKIPAFFLSYYVGIELLSEINTVGNTPRVRMNVDVTDAVGIANICADTLVGDPTKTIVIGAHSDSVPAGSGINDNGSGSIGILVLALNLAKLLKRNDIAYRYRIRFCWWGAEEIGLLGSYYHVAQASLSSETRVGERLTDYLMNLNYDMLAGPNYRFGIHDYRLVLSDTPVNALDGTQKLTELFRGWFDAQDLPWSNSSLSGGSDYLPFLQRGVAVGGVNTGAGGIKPASERDQYSAKLGIGFGGIANAAYDPCYHQQCDRSMNLNLFAFENVVKSAAYAIETLGRYENLEGWLYPKGRQYLMNAKIEKPKYNRDNYPELI